MRLEVNSNVLLYSSSKVKCGCFVAELGISVETFWVARELRERPSTKSTNEMQDKRMTMEIRECQGRMKMDRRL